MKTVAQIISRFLLLAIVVCLGHAILLWLWDPWIAVQPPREIPLDQKEPSKKAELTIVVGGDTALTDASLLSISQYGYEYPLSATVDLVREADLTVVNLEAAVTNKTTPFPLYKNYIYKVDPDGLAALSWAGIDAVTLANNHVMDYGREGFADTLQSVQSVKIAPIGAGRKEAEARQGVVFVIRGTRVGVLAYMEDTFMHSLYMRSFADIHTPGCARLGGADLRADLKRIRKYADYVIVIVHWGRTYEGVTMTQRLYGRLMIEMGADIVIGHGPHIHQPVAMHHGKPILYSVGNYAFGTPGAHQWFRYGMLARLRLSNKQLREVELIPLMVQNSITKFRPYRLEGAEAKDMLQNLAFESAQHGARILVRDNIGVLTINPSS